MMKFSFFISFFMTAYIASSQSVNIFNRIHYSTKDGLPSNTVYCAEQDDNGFIWFGTDAGLSRFDGVEFINYGLKDGLPDMEVLNFYKDFKGRIWIYSFNGKICFIENGQIFTSKNTPFLKDADFNSQITSINVRDDRIYITSLRDGVKIIDANDGILRSLKYERRYTYGAIVGNAFYSFVSFPSAFEFFYQPLDSIDANLSFKPFKVSLGEDVQSTALSYCGVVGDEIFGISHVQRRNYIFLFNTEARKFKLKQISDYKVYNFEIAEDNIYLFTNEGVKLLDPVTLEITDYIDLEETTLFTQDFRGNVWLTTLNNGVFFLPKNEVKRKTDKTFDEVLGMYATDSNLYVVNRDMEVFALSNNDHKRFIFKLEGESRFQTIEVDSLGAIWTLNSAFLRKNNKEVSLSNSDSRTGSNFFYRDDILIVLKMSNLSWVDLDKEIDITVNNDRLGKIYGYELLAPERAVLANQHGLFLLDIEAKSISIIPGFEDVRVTGISSDKYDNFWFATAGYGLVRVPKKELNEFSLEKLRKFKINNYSDVYEKLLIVDSVIYATNPRGVTRVLFDEVGARYQYHISESNGLEPGKIHDLEYFNGEVFIGQSNGLFSFPHTQVFAGDPAFPLYIERISTNDSVYTNLDGAGISLSYNSGPISFETKTVYFRNQNDLTYQFRILGSSLESTWSTSGSNEFVFQGLPPGDYYFEVRAKSTNSPWTPPVRQPFTIKSIYWQTWWFKTAIALTIVTFVSLILIFSSAAKRKREELKKKKIESDLKALKAQINPHFLFNSLNSIQSFVLEGNTAIAEDYLVKYSKLMRTILNHSNLLSVSIYEEIESMNLYVELERLRLFQPLDFKVSIDNDIDAFNTKIPSMVVQPLIENSIWHGIQSMNDPGEILLNFELKDKIIHVTVADNGTGFNRSTIDSQPRGIQLIQERIDLINKLEGIESNFKISSGDSGTKVIFSYPSNLN